MENLSDKMEAMVSKLWENYNALIENKNFEQSYQILKHIDMIDYIRRNIK